MSAVTVSVARPAPSIVSSGGKSFWSPTPSGVDPLRQLDALQTVLAKIEQTDALEPSSAARPAVDRDSSTCPPWPTAQIRLARVTPYLHVALRPDVRLGRVEADPNQRSSRDAARLASERCISATASTASLTRSKATKKASP